MRSRRHLHMHIATYEQFRPTLLNSLNCLKVYRVFKGTCRSVRCAQTCEVRLVRSRLFCCLHVHIATCEQFMPTPLNMLDCLKVHRVFKGTRCSVRCAHTCKVHIRTIYADNVEHARLFKSISSVQRYSLQRSMRMWPLVKKTAVKDCLEGPLGPSVFPNAST